MWRTLHSALGPAYGEDTSWFTYKRMGVHFRYFSTGWVGNWESLCNSTLFSNLHLGDLLVYYRTWRLSWLFQPILQKTAVPLSLAQECPCPLLLALTPGNGLHLNVQTKTLLHSTVLLCTTAQTGFHGNTSAICLWNIWSTLYSFSIAGLLKEFPVLLSIFELIWTVEFYGGVNNISKARCQWCTLVNGNLKSDGTVLRDFLP